MRTICFVLFTISAFYCFLLLQITPMMMPMISVVPPFVCNDSVSGTMQPDTCGPQCTYLFNQTAPMSIIYEWDLICERRLYATLPDLLFMIGFFVGSFLASPIADLVGRRVNAIGSMTGVSISLYLALVPSDNVIGFSICRFCQGVFAAAGYNGIYCIFIEFAPAEKRSAIVPFIGERSITSQTIDSTL